MNSKNRKIIILGIGIPANHNTYTNRQNTGPTTGLRSNDSAKRQLIRTKAQYNCQQYFLKPPIDAILARPLPKQP